MGTPVVIDPYHLDLTEESLLDLGVSPLYLGDTVTWRFRVGDENDAAQSLAGATMVISAWDREASAAPLFSRKSSVNITGHTPNTKELEADADQSTENTAAGTGKGWFEVRFKPADQTNLAAHVGKGRDFALVIKFGDGSQRTYARGQLDVLRRRVLLADVP